MLRNSSGLIYTRFKFGSRTLVLPLAELGQCGGDNASKEANNENSQLVNFPTVLLFIFLGGGKSELKSKGEGKRPRFVNLG